MPTIVGIPNSRATIAECDNALPRSMSIPRNAGNSVTHPGSVRSATSMSPTRLPVSTGFMQVWTVPTTTPGQQLVPARLVGSIPSERFAAPRKSFPQ